MTEYNYFDDKESITGQIYIGDDNYLYITDTNKNYTDSYCILFLLKNTKILNYFSI